MAERTLMRGGVLRFPGTDLAPMRVDNVRWSLPEGEPTAIALYRAPRGRRGQRRLTATRRAQAARRNWQRWCRSTWAPPGPDDRVCDLAQLPEVLPLSAAPTKALG